uniref:At1g61320/AtMIF1 LRR domain-containing protein n=1 Tax=Aegilops tauschii TaxID=37682 RepID=R7WB47_AEGTA
MQDIWWHIHSLMPMRDAARAACVSRTFMHSWRRRTSLTFSKKTLGIGEDVCEKDGKARDLTFKVDRIWIEHPGIGVKEVRIEFYDNTTRVCFLDRWLQIAVTPGIEELIVIPSVGHKRKWKLDSVSVPFQQLGLSHCSKIIRLKIPSLLQRLITLEVSACKRLQTIEIEAQCLSKFWFSGERLVQLSFGEALQLKTLDMHCHGAVCEARANLPSTLPNLETLSVFSYFETVNTPMVGSKFPFLKHLTVKLAAAPAYDYCSLISFFDASPSLETFFLNGFEGSMQHPSILADPSGRRQMPKHRHDKLKNVTIAGFSSAKSLVDLTCHILESSESLESLTLDTTEGYDYLRCSVNRSGKCFRMRRGAILEARRGLLAIKTYIEGIVPPKVKFTVVKPCSQCHVVEL